MTSQEDFLEGFERTPEEMATRSLRLLVGIARVRRMERLEKFLLLHEGAVREEFLRQPALTKLLREFVRSNTPCTTETLGRHHPSLLLSLGVLFALLEDQLAPQLSEAVELQRLLRDAVSTLGATWVLAIAPQRKRLAQLVSMCVRTVDTYRLGRGRVFLVECPIGNSVPTKLIRDELAKHGISGTVVQIALSRNTRRGSGPTRRDLIEQRLREAGVRRDDLLIYADEWLSGVNFSAIGEILGKQAKTREAFLLPIAAVAAGANSHPRFASFVRDHDQLAAGIGLRGECLRFEFPPLVVDGGRSEQALFWSESDRLAGVRKMPFLGAYLGSLRDAVKRLLDSDDDLWVVQRVLLAEEGRAGVKREEHQFRHLFYEPGTQGLAGVLRDGYADFTAWFDEVQAVEHSSNHGDSPDPEADLAELSKILVESLSNRKARNVAMLGVLYLREFASSPRDQYCLRGHVPVVYPLKGAVASLAQTYYSLLYAVIGEDVQACAG